MQAKAPGMGAAGLDPGSFCPPSCGQWGQGGVQEGKASEGPAPGQRQSQRLKLSPSAGAMGLARRVKGQERKARAGEGSDLLEKGLTGQVGEWER